MRSPLPYHLQLFITTIILLRSRWRGAPPPAAVPTGVGRCQESGSVEQRVRGAGEGAHAGGKDGDKEGNDSDHRARLAVVLDSRPVGGNTMWFIKSAKFAKSRQ